jgi:hypothetical protein
MAISVLRPQHRATAGADIKELTGIGRHLLWLGRGTVWTGDHGFKDHGIPEAPVGQRFTDRW